MDSDSDWPLIIYSLIRTVKWQRHGSSY